MTAEHLTFDFATGISTGTIRRPVSTSTSLLFRSTDPWTSQAAAALPGKQTAKQRALKALKAAGERGLTDYELSLELGMQRHIAARRRCDLVQDGMVVATDGTRPTDTGAQAVVWRIA